MRHLTRKMKDRLLNDDDITAWFSDHDIYLPYVLSEARLVF